MAANLEFIKSESADNVSSLTVTNIFSAKYDVYEVFVTGNGSQNTGSITAQFLDSSGTAIGLGSVQQAVQRLKYASAYDPIWGATNNAFEMVYTGAADLDFGIKMTVYNPFSNSEFTYVGIQAISEHAAKGIVCIGSTTSAEQMKFYANQNYTPIKVSVYGVKD